MGGEVTLQVVLVLSYLRISLQQTNNLLTGFYHFPPRFPNHNKKQKNLWSSRVQHETEYGRRCMERLNQSGHRGGYPRDTLLLSGPSIPWDTASTYHVAVHTAAVTRSVPTNNIHKQTSLSTLNDNLTVPGFAWRGVRKMALCAHYYLLLATRTPFVIYACFITNDYGTCSL